MLTVDQLRGQDSTGVAFVTRENDVFVSKEVGTPNILLDTKSFARNLARFNKALIGHNRYATQGAVNRRNAHPFEFDTLVGVHNGTLRNKHKLLDHTQFIVDSENAYHHIENKGLSDFVNIVDGAYALVWFDKVEGELNMIRNAERPLFSARSKDGKSLYWASEEWMISAICARERVEIDKPLLLGVDMHYRYTFDDIGAIADVHIKEGKQPVRVYFQNNVFQNQGVNNYNNVQQRQSNVVQITHKQGESVGKTSASQSVSVELVERYAGLKDAKFEIAGKGKDRNGASYLSLLFLQEPALSIRLYVKKNDKLLNQQGTVIQGTIGGFNTLKGEGGFFKVVPTSVKVIEELDEPFVLNDGSDEDVVETLFRDHKGELHTAEEWEKKYPRCAWCSDKLTATDNGNHLIDGDPQGCLCPSCSNDKEVTEYVNLTKVF